MPETALKRHSNFIKPRHRDMITGDDDEERGKAWLQKSTTWKDHVLQAASNVWHNQAIALFLLALS